MFGDLGPLDAMWRSLDPFWTLAAIVGVLLGVAILITICVVVGRIILGPLNERAGRLRAPTQFQLSDFFWLVAQVQVALIVAVRTVGIEQFYYFLVVGGFLVLATMAMWIGAVSFMSRAGVTQPLRRAVFILFLLPLTLALMIGSALEFLFVAGGALIFFASRGHTAPLVGTVPIVVLSVVAILGCVWGMRQIAIWILAQRPSDNPVLDIVTAEVAATKSTTSPLSGA